MTSKNRNGDIAVSATKLNKQQQWDLYDSLPAEIRKIMQNAPYDLILNAKNSKLIGNPKILRRTIRHVAVESARNTYGSNYPLALIKV